MTNFVHVIKACESAGGAGTKQAILAALKTADPTAQKLIKEALNPFRVFGVKKYDMPTTAASKDLDANYEVFFKMLDELCERTITGNSARDAVTSILSRFTKESQEYLARVLDKDLKAGFSDETVNKVFPNLVPIFDVMLADKCDDTEDFEKYVTFPCQADFKYDGERTVAFVKKDEIVYYSRSGKEAKHVDGLFDADLYAIHKYLGYDFILDGERCSDKGFTDTVNAKKSGNDAAKANLRFRAFFLMPLTDWLAKKTKITMCENRSHLAEILNVVKPAKIILTEGREVKDYQDMMAYCNDAIDLPENKARKIEGLILKNWDSTYLWDRTFAWTKVKRFYDVDARIVGFYPGRPKSRLANTIGGVNCVAFLESGERVEFNVGSGFSDEQRADMKANPDKWLAGTHVIKYQEVSRAKNKAVASLRFCTLERAFRDDKHVEI